MKPKSRRQFNKAILGTAAALPFLGSKNTAAAEKKFPISVFSKHLQFLDYERMADTAAEIGFDGVDLTVRPKGHVLPQNVVRDLPRAVKAVEKAGLGVAMITTRIDNAADKSTHLILKTASDLGIRYYRMGYLRYDKELSPQQNLQAFSRVFTELNELNETYGLTGCYQNHSGMYFGAPLWDLWMVLKALPSDRIGSQYDIRHATVEGATAWPLGLDLLENYIHTIVIKDFYWQKRGSEWRIKNCPVGDGMVDFKSYFETLGKKAINVPVSLHFEYPLAEEIDDPKTRRRKTMEMMGKDLSALRSLV